VSTTHTTLLPHAPYPVHWRSTSYAAKFYGKTRRAIVKWCIQGRFAAVNIPVFQDVSGRWWVLLSDESVSMKEHEALTLL